jgi:2OG-Fe(II) oxygenase superfamily
MENFIRTWPNLISKEICDEYIARFEEVINDPKYKNIIDQRTGTSHRDDIGIDAMRPEFDKTDLNKFIREQLHQCVKEYGNSFTGIHDYNLVLTNKQIKIQKTNPMGGFHVWHTERSAQYLDRYLAWMIYLNDMPDGEAETEFLYQCLRIKPTVGTVVIWPADFTHLHRGLTVYTQPKYILTGWFTIDATLSRMQYNSKNQ